MRKNPGGYSKKYVDLFITFEENISLFTFLYKIQLYLALDMQTITSLTSNTLELVIHGINMQQLAEPFYSQQNIIMAIDRRRI